MNPYEETAEERPLNLFHSDVESIYLAGPMSGIKDNNALAFKQAAEELRDDGFMVVNPVEMDEEIGSDHDSGSLSEEDYTAFLGRDIIRILDEDVDALVALPGWEESRGVALEVHVARELGKKVFSWPSGDQIKRPTEYRPPSDENVLEEADRLTAGAKHEEYGHPLDDFERTARIATAVLDGFLRPGMEVQPWHIPLLMIGVKISRQVNMPKRKNFTHIAGYARTGELVAEEMERRGLEMIRPKIGDDGEPEITESE
jgi:hypothetical protein